MALTKFTEKLISDSFKTSISGSDNAESASISTRLTTAESELGNTLVSSSAQIATDISGSFNSTSSSLASRVTVNEGRVNQGVNTTDSPTFAGGTVTGNFTVGGTLTAQEVHTEFESASILFTSGSTIFGNSSDDVHEFKGNKISGSSTSTASLAMISLADKIEHIGDTNNTIEFGTDEIKLRTGGSSRLIARDSNVELYNDLIVAGDVTIPQKIIHSGDTDNYLSFGTDSLSIYHGGAEKIQFNYGNIYIKTNNQSLVGYNTGGSAKELIKINDSNLVQIGEASGGDVAITEKLTVGSWDNSNTHGHANLNVSSDANEGADSYINFAAGTTVKGHIAYDHHATAGSQAMRFVVGDDAVTAMNILGSGYLEIGAAGGNENTYSNSNHAAKVSIDGTWGDPSTGSNSGDTNAIMRIAGSGHSNAIDFGVHSSSPYSGWIQGTNRGTSGGSTGVYGLSLNPLGGSVGIGTANPGGILDVFSGSSRLFQVQTDGVGVGNNNPGTYGVLHVSGVGDTSITGSVFYDGYGETGISGNPVGPHILCLSSTAEASSDVGIEDMGPSMIFRGQPGTGLDGGATFAAIAGTLDQSNATYGAKGNLRLFTSSGYNFNPEYGTELVERMRIDSSGRVGIGQTSPLYKLDMLIGSATHIARFRNEGNNYTMHGIIISCGKNSPNSAGDCNYIFFQDGGGTSRGGIRNSSTADNPEFFNGSDLRMKKDVTETKVNGLETINAIPLKEWNWNSKKEQPKTKIGIVADDLEKVLPELVSRQISLEGWEHCVKDGEEPLKTVPTETQLTLILMKAVQELSTENDDLKKRMEALESN